MSDHGTELLTEIPKWTYIRKQDSKIGFSYIYKYVALGSFLFNIASSIFSHDK